MQTRHRRSRARGFTLVELLVALFVMAILALMSWRGMDAMLRAQAQNQQRSAAIMALQNGLAQWVADLDAVQWGSRHSLEWNGNSLRLTRSTAEGGVAALRVVAWSLRPGDAASQWTRWQSPVFSTTAEAEAAWAAAALWAQGAAATPTAGSFATPVVPVLDWKVLYYRETQWTETIAATAATEKGPDAVRLQLNLAPGMPISGRITRDWLRPTLAGNKS